VSFSINDLSPVLGAEVRGIDLRQPVDDAVAEQLRRALEDRLLVVFRDQDLTEADQVEALRIFGPVLDEFGNGALHSFVSNVDQEAYVGGDGVNTNELVFHSDWTNTGAPPWALSLYAVEVSDDAPPTTYVNAQRGYERLSPGLRERVDHLEVIDRMGTAVADMSMGEGVGMFPSCTHPAVITHPRNGRRQVYCNRMWSNGVVGMDDAAAQQFLGELFGELYDPANSYTHSWATGDLVVWDNVALQHGRSPVPPGCRRHFRRVLVGESPVVLAGAPDPPGL
jgi:taurine dioxygenase